MEEVILVSPHVVSYLKQLVDVLHDNEYFGFEEDAHQYVEKLRNIIYKELPYLIHYITPPEISHYGNHYVKYKSTKRTMWYIFFSKNENRYLIEFITNNHMTQSSYLNKL